MILTSVFICACGADTETTTEVTADSLSGRWELFSALRNGESTQSLDGTYIEFEKGNMTTNFTGVAVQTPVKLEDQKLTQEEQVYTITSLSNDTLAITTSLMNYDFRLHFAKNEQLPELD
jgi:hypothetical protein